MNSKGTFQYQNDLPKLPVPKLQETLQKYLKSARVLVDEEQFAKTEAIVKEFGRSDGMGEQLYQYILDKANCSNNWINKYPNTD